MNTGKPENPGARDFDRDLNEVESQYRAAYTDEPPAMLDQAILNKARRAVKSHSIRPWSFGWMHASATAAVLVLGLTLVLQQRSEISVPPPVLDRLESNQPMAATADKDSSVLQREEISGTVESLNAAKDSQQEVERSMQLFTVSSARPNEIEELKTEGQQAFAMYQQIPALEQESPMPVTDFSDLVIALPGIDSRQDGAADPIVAMSSRSATARLHKISVSDESDSPALGTSLAASPAETRLDAESWIEHILELKLATESDDQADAIDWQEELELFLETYPDYPLPKELADAAERIEEAAGRQ